LHSELLKLLKHREFKPARSVSDLYWRPETHFVSK